MSNELTVQQAQEVLQAVNPVENWLDPAKFNQMARVSSVLAKSSIVPQNYQNKPEDCLIAFDMASRMGTNPLMVMQNLYVVKGKPSWSGQACAVLIANSRKFTDIEHIRTGEVGSDSRGCYYTAVDKHTGETLKGVEVTVAMAKAEGWYSQNPKWRNLTELMLMYRAASFFAKEFCPDVLMGVQTDGDIEDSSSRPIRKPVLANDLAEEIDSLTEGMPE